jgi:hypothetical protein
LVAAIVLLSIAAQRVGAKMTPLEANTDRPGRDFDNLPVSSADACRTHCDTHDRCLAMTFVRHPDKAGGICWLKDAVPGASHNDSMTSATKELAPMGSKESGIDRPGSDITSLPGSDAEQCRMWCGAMTQCRAMTFVQNEGGAGGTCWLKHAEPAKQPTEGMTSAVKAFADNPGGAASCVMSGSLSGDLQWAKRVVARDGAGTEHVATVSDGRYSLSLPAGHHTVVVSAGKMQAVTTPRSREVDCTGGPIQGDFRIDRYEEG